MTRDAVISRVLPIMAKVFEDDGLVYSDSLTAQDVAEWDSLSHIRFIVVVERTFDIRFAPEEMERFETVGQLVDAILTHVKD